MSKSPDEIFNEAMQKEAYERFDENPFVAFERCADWLKENPHLIPSVKGLVDALIHIKKVSDTVINPSMTQSTLSMKHALDDCYGEANEALKAFGDKT